MNHSAIFWPSRLRPWDWTNLACSMQSRLDTEVRPHLGVTVKVQKWKRKPGQDDGSKVWLYCSLLYACIKWALIVFVYSAGSFAFPSGQRYRQAKAESVSRLGVGHARWIWKVRCYVKNPSLSTLLFFFVAIFQMLHCTAESLKTSEWKSRKARKQEREREQNRKESLNWRSGYNISTNPVWAFTTTHYPHAKRFTFQPDLSAEFDSLIVVSLVARE